MSEGIPIFSRRNLLLMAGAAALRADTPAPDFWNQKPSSQWTVGDIYQLANHSPWARQVRTWENYSQPTPYGQPPARPFSGPVAVVLWESAQPIRDALKKPLPPVFRDYYVVSVDGLPFAGRSLRSLAIYTTLHSKGKPKHTAHATLARQIIRNSAVCAFGFFKRALPLDLDTEEVVFESHFGGWFVEAKFKVRDMLYHGQLAI